MLHPEQFPLRYTDPLSDESTFTSQYPCNPNGRIMGIAGMISQNGRHLGMMPHPERCIMNWQLPWCPEKFKLSKYSPWMKFFQNAILMIKE